MVGTLVKGCRCATSWCYLDLTFDLAIVTLISKLLSGPYLRICKGYEVDFYMNPWLESVGMLNHVVTFNLGSAEVCSPAIFETYFSYQNDICIAETSAISIDSYTSIDKCYSFIIFSLLINAVIFLLNCDVFILYFYIHFHYFRHYFLNFNIIWIFI